MPNCPFIWTLSARRAIDCVKIREQQHIPHILNHVMFHTFTFHYLSKPNFCTITWVPSVNMGQRSTDSLIFRDIQWNRLNCYPHHAPSSFKTRTVVIFPLLLHSSGDIWGYSSNGLWHTGRCISASEAYEIPIEKGRLRWLRKLNSPQPEKTEENINITPPKQHIKKKSTANHSQVIQLSVSEQIESKNTPNDKTQSINKNHCRLYMQTWLTVEIS